MDFIIRLFISFLMLSCMYTLVAIGFTMYVGVINLANFSHGDTCVIGAFVLMLLYGFLSYFGITQNGSFIYVQTIIIFTIILTGLWGVLVFKVVINPLLNSPRLIVLLATVATGQAIREIIRVTYPEGSNPQVFPKIFPDGGIFIKNFLIRWENIIIFFLTIIILIIINLFINKTKIGLSMRCVSQNYEVSQMMGINVNKTIMMVFIIGSALAGLAGIMNGAYYRITKFDIGSNLGIKGFSAAVIGGLGNTYGAIIGGLIISFVEIFISGLIKGGSQFQDLFSFIVVLIFLIIKPSGILGEKTYEKV